MTSAIKPASDIIVGFAGMTHRIVSAPPSRESLRRSADSVLNLSGGFRRASLRSRPDLDELCAPMALGKPSPAIFRGSRNATSSIFHTTCRPTIGAIAILARSSALSGGGEGVTPDGFW
jgi:hypothetical protein